MTVLDSSTIIDYLDGVAAVVSYVDDRTQPPYLTPALCVYEVLMGAVDGEAEADPAATRAEFGWVGSVDVSETAAIESVRLQRRALASGTRLSPRDALVAGTAAATGHGLVATDADFEAVGDLFEVAVVIGG